MALNTHDLEKFRKLILADRERLQRELAGVRVSGDEQEEVGELTDVDFNHPGDAGTETFERGKDMALGANARALIAEADAALAKLDAGTYGTCERCGKPIAPARLQDLPYAIHCIDCQRHIEATA